MTHFCKHFPPIRDPVAFTRAAPKVMPPIYFHGNHNRYKEHNNTI